MIITTKAKSLLHKGESSFLSHDDIFSLIPKKEELHLQFRLQFVEDPSKTKAKSNKEEEEEVPVKRKREDEDQKEIVEEKNDKVVKKSKTKQEKEEGTYERQIDIK
jgi:hypothetical protein